ncbi:cysteine-rich secretory protein LCCL domain-containing 2-like [Mytilus trossulus]|uniref:cysteine-rich secretory protein LCCL domain-containing 2-like n=1 Tax=Mytilus trossulus TaxID=6551 RepID=UPI0030042A96
MHNKIRGEVSPAASPALPSLEWDDQLASKAEQWAQGCDFSHNQDKSSALGTVGENIAINQDPIHEGIQDWEKEKSDWTYGNSDTGCTGGSCGHYTQMIWAATTKIGCGVATCSQFTSSDGDDMSGFDGYKYLVCNYYQAGNFPGEPPYKTGTGGEVTTGEGTNKGGETDLESFY